MIECKKMKKDEGRMYYYNLLPRNLNNSIVCNKITCMAYLFKSKIICVGIISFRRRKKKWICWAWGHYTFLFRFSSQYSHFFFYLFVFASVDLFPFIFFSLLCKFNENKCILRKIQKNVIVTANSHRPHICTCIIRTRR